MIKLTPILLRYGLVCIVWSSFQVRLYILFEIIKSVSHDNYANYLIKNMLLSFYKIDDFVS